MDIRLRSTPPEDAAADVLALPCFEEDLRARRPDGSIGALDRKLGGRLLAAAKEERFAGGAESSLAFPTWGGLAAGRLLLLGLGKRERFGTEALRHAAARAVRAASRVSAQRLALALPGAGEADAEIRAAAEGAALGAYRFDRYRTDEKGRREPPRAVDLLAASPAEVRGGAGALDLAREVAGAVAWARDLVNEPAGALTPSRLADEARAMARTHRLRVEVFGPEAIRTLRMGLFLGVAQGSAEEPRLIHVWYQPGGSAARRPPLAIVGKAITFDSGGLSLKTNEGMLDMKTDMAGAAAALAAMRTVRALAPPFPVHAFMGACENMPGGRAYKLGDVLVSRSGKTVEITNTDAEGRLVLGDVLAWASSFRPAAMVDLATLTGACVVALGHWTAGAFSPDEALAAEILAAAATAGEDVWRMPLTDWVKDTLDSDVADMRNAGERWGGAIAAAHFLSRFTGGVPWLHLDIAGPAFSHKERGYIPKGGTGFGVRTLVDWIRHRADGAKARR